MPNHQDNGQDEDYEIEADKNGHVIEEIIAVLVSIDGIHGEVSQKEHKLEQQYDRDFIENLHQIVEPILHR